MRHGPCCYRRVGAAATAVFLAIATVTLLCLKVPGEVVAGLTVIPEDSRKRASSGSAPVAYEPSKGSDTEIEPPVGSAAVGAANSSQETDGDEPKSHRMMFVADPVVIEITRAKDYKKILEVAAQQHKAVIIMLYSAWCPHCFSFRNTFSRLADDLQRNFYFAGLNCVENDEVREICFGLGVVSVPSIKLFVPAPIHLQLPSPYKNAKPIGTQAGKNFPDLVDLREGGALNSFDKSTMAIHTLALPGQDIYAAVHYAAVRTLQIIPKSRLQKTVGKLPCALDGLKEKPCVVTRWNAEELAYSSGLRKHGSPEVSRAPDALINARVHDAIRGLQLVLASWVITSSERLTRDEEFALIDLLEVVRATIPLKSVKRSAALAILHLFNSTGTHATEKKPQPVTTRRAIFGEVLNLYDEVDKKLRETKGLTTAAWRTWIGRLPFGENAPALAPLEEPKLKHCTTHTCSVWMLLHIVAEGAADLAKRITEDSRCGPTQVFFKRKSQALPIYLFEKQQESGKAVDMNEVLDLASMDTSELINYDPSLGCMIVPSFDVAYTIYNVLRRFFACAECRHHFELQFSRRTHGLLDLQPPQGVYSLSTPPSLDGSDSRSLIEKYRTQENGSHEAWSERRVEADKLDKLKLWMWRFHNAVNVRTAADTTLSFVKGDQEARNYVNCDARWPSRNMCDLCRSGATPITGYVSPSLLLQRDADDDIFSIEEEVSDFDQKALLDFLRTSYWPKAFEKK